MIADDFRKPTLTPVTPVEFVFPEAPQRMPVFLANEENPHVVSALRRIRQHARPGAIIFLTAEEFEAITDPEEFRALIPT